MAEDEVYRDYFIFYRSFRDALNELPDDMRGKLYTAIADYALDFIEPTLDDAICRAFWSLIKPQLDANIRRSMAGKKGGNPHLKKGKKYTEQGSSNVEPSTEQGSSNGSSNVEPSTEQGSSNVEPNKNKNKNKNNEEDKPSSDEEGMSSENSDDPAKEKEKYDFEAFCRFFNRELQEAKSVIPRISKITGTRKNSISARLREFTEEDLRTVVHKAATSDFLNGKNNRGWIADFNWIFRPNNFPKVLEGNYDNDKILQNGSYSACNRQEQKARANAAVMQSAQAAVLRVVQGVEREKPNI